METAGSLPLYRSCTPVIDAAYDRREDSSISQVLAETLAAVEGVPVTEIPPLYDAIDIEALDKLLAGGRASGDTDAILGFTYENWNVFVRSDGQIRVCDSTESIEPEPVFGE